MNYLINLSGESQSFPSGGAEMSHQIFMTMIKLNIERR